MGELTMDEIIAITTNSTENHESTAVMNHILPTTNILEHASGDQQLPSPVSIYSTSFHAAMYSKIRS